MSEKVEITKAVVSINAVMVDGKAMTLAVFDQIEEGDAAMLLNPGLLVLGRVRRSRECGCGYVHGEWILGVADGFLCRIGRHCKPSDPPRYCQRPFPHGSGCLDCAEDDKRRATRSKAVDDVFESTEQVFIAVGGSR